MNHPSYKITVSGSFEILSIITYLNNPTTERAMGRYFQQCPLTGGRKTRSTLLGKEQWAKIWSKQHECNQYWIDWLHQSNLPMHSLHGYLNVSVAFLKNLWKHNVSMTSEKFIEACGYSLSTVGLCPNNQIRCNKVDQLQLICIQFASMASKDEAIPVAFLQYNSLESPTHKLRGR